MSLKCNEQHIFQKLRRRRHVPNDHQLYSIKKGVNVWVNIIAFLTKTVYLFSSTWFFLTSVTGASSYLFLCDDDEDNDDDDDVLL